MLAEDIPIAFWIDIEVIFWLIKANKLLDIPIPAIKMVLIDIRDKNWEKLSIKFLIPIAEFSGDLILIFFSLDNSAVILFVALFLSIVSENLTLYS